MRIIKKIMSKRKYAPPPKAPCGHVPPVFRALNGKLVTVIAIPLHPTVSGKVWCGDCRKMVNVNDELFNEYRRFNGIQETN